MVDRLSLADVVGRLALLEDSGMLCVRRPWTAQAECVVVAPDTRLGVPRDISAQGFEYFLEVEVAREVLSILGGRSVSPGDKVQLLLHYAEHDAYPSWAYSRGS